MVKCNFYPCQIFFQLTKESHFFLSHVFSSKHNLPQISKAKKNCIARSREEKEKLVLRKT